MTRRSLSAALRAFRDDENGSVTVEAILMIPILVWCYLATFVFFDAFRTQSINIKAAYTIGDTLSRETGYVTPNYLTGLFGLQNMLLATDETRALQITAFTYDQPNDKFLVRWSRGIGGLSGMSDADLAAVRAILPNMPHGEIAILTRSRVNYEPRFSVGIHPFVFDELTVTRPRFAPQICWNSVENGSVSTSTC